MLEMLELKNSKRGVPIAVFKIKNRKELPWVVAYGFNYKSEDWLEGFYFETEEEAKEIFNKKVSE